MKQFISVFAITALLFYSCTGSTKNENEQANFGIDMDMQQEGDTLHHNNGNDGHHDMAMNSDMENNMDTPSITVQKTQTASAGIDAYLGIKNALVEDDDEEAAMAGKDLMNAFDNIDISSIPADKTQEFREIIVDAKEHADHISENQGNIEHQREHFELLSTDIKDMIVITGTDRTLFQIFCPMYNNNQGGMWLSASNDIKNPYYGSEMINCGNIETIISIQ